jgi:hypothetical protein
MDTAANASPRGGLMRPGPGLLLAVPLSAAIAVGGALAAAQSNPPPPPRDAAPGAPAPIGTHEWAGVVLAADTGRPLHRALVQPQTGNLATGRYTTTDVEGRWTFAQVPPGAYTSSAHLPRALRPEATSAA